MKAFFASFAIAFVIYTKICKAQVKEEYTLVGLDLPNGLKNITWNINDSQEKMDKIARQSLAALEYTVPVEEQLDFLPDSEIIELKDLIQKYVCNADSRKSDEDVCFDVGNAADDWLYNVCHSRICKVCSILSIEHYEATCKYFLYSYVCAPIEKLTRQKNSIDVNTGEHDAIEKEDANNRTELSIFGNQVVNVCTQGLKTLDDVTRSSLKGNAINCQDAKISFSEGCEDLVREYCSDIDNLFLQGVCTALVPTYLCN